MTQESGVADAGTPANSILAAIVTFVTVVGMVKTRIIFQNIPADRQDEFGIADFQACPRVGNTSTTSIPMRFTKPSWFKLWAIGGANSL